MFFRTVLEPAAEVCAQHRRAQLCAPPLTTHTGTRGTVRLPEPSVEELLTFRGMGIVFREGSMLVDARLPDGWYIADSRRSVCHGYLCNHRDEVEADVFIDTSLPPRCWTLTARPLLRADTSPAPRIEIDPARWPFAHRRYATPAPTPSDPVRTHKF